VPSDVGSSSTSPADTVSSSLMANAGGGCGALWFNNQSTSLNSTLMLPSNGALVAIPDNTSGSGAVTTGSAWVNASDATTTPHWVASGASIGTATNPTTTVQVFPGLPFVTGGGGLVNITVQSASLSCLATVPSNGGSPTYSASAAYSVKVQYWQATDTSGGGAYQTLTINWSSGSTATDPLTALNLGNIVVYQNGGTVLHLSDYISTWSSARSIVESQNNGLHQLPGVINLTTAPVRVGDPASGVGVQVGALSCSAEDDR
jgi:hypothetical protein